MRKKAGNGSKLVPLIVKGNYKQDSGREIVLSTSKLISNFRKGLGLGNFIIWIVNEFMKDTSHRISTCLILAKLAFRKMEKKYFWLKVVFKKEY